MKAVPENAKGSVPPARTAAAISSEVVATFPALSRRVSLSVVKSVAAAPEKGEKEEWQPPKLIHRWHEVAKLQDPPIEHARRVALPSWYHAPHVLDSAQREQARDVERVGVEGPIVVAT